MFWYLQHSFHWAGETSVFVGGNAGRDQHSRRNTERRNIETRGGGIARNNGKTANTISPSHFCSQVLSLFYLIWSLRFLLFLIIKLNIDCLPALEHLICTFSKSSLGLRRINLIYMFFGLSGKNNFFCISIPFEFSSFLFSENKLNLHDF